MAQETNKPIKDIDRDMAKLKKRKPTLNRELTESYAAVAGEAFEGGI